MRFLGLRVCRAVPKVTHLFFANDTLIFTKASMRDCEGILSAINKYRVALEQRITFEKSNLLFNPNVTQQNQD